MGQISKCENLFIYNKVITCWLKYVLSNLDSIDISLMIVSPA